MACVLINGLDTDTAIDALSRALGSPFDVTGAAHTPSGLDGHPVTMIRIEGFAQSVAYRSEQLRSLFADHDVTVETDPDNVSAGWRWVRDVEAFQNKDGDVWRISVKPSDAPETARRIGATETLFDWGGGLIWALVASGSDLRAAMGGIPGHATLVRRSSPSDIPTFQPEPDALARLTAGLKSRFDPRGILNTGFMVG
jgi:glycolate oxidase FAD binding subunit